MDERFLREVMHPGFGSYCHSADGELRLTESCEDLADLLGMLPSELEGKRLSFFLDPKSAGAELKCLRQQIDADGSTEVILTFLRKDGSPVRVLAGGRLEDSCGVQSFRCFFMTAEKTAGRIARLQNELELYKKKLSQYESRIVVLQTRAEQDSLTGIFNSDTTKNLSKAYLSESGYRCALLIIDVDDFKHINDRYGHMVGDKVMIGAANAIKKLFRSNDIVGRVGGDEFLVLMKDIPDTGIVATRCGQIIEAFNKMRFDGMGNESISCSVGAAVSDVIGISYDKMFLCADMAMYRAKNAGGGRYVIEECK